MAPNFTDPNWWRQLGDTLDKALFPHFDPSKSVMRLPNNGDKPTTTATTRRQKNVFDDVYYDHKKKTHVRATTNAATNTFEWADVAKPSQLVANGDKCAELTDFDFDVLQEFAASGKYDITIDEAKAAIIKPYWFDGVPREMAAQTIAAKTKMRGYSDKIIKLYYSIFNEGYKRQVESTQTKLPETTH